MKIFLVLPCSSRFYILQYFTLNSNQLRFFQHAQKIVFHVSDLMIASMLIQQRDDRLDVILLDNIQHLWTLNQNTIQHLQDSCQTKVTIDKYRNIASPCLYGKGKSTILYTIIHHWKQNIMQLNATQQSTAFVAGIFF